MKWSKGGDATSRYVIMDRAYPLNAQDSQDGPAKFGRIQSADFQTPWMEGELEQEKFVMRLLSMVYDIDREVGVLPSGIFGSPGDYPKSLNLGLHFAIQGDKIVDRRSLGPAVHGR